MKPVLSVFIIVTALFVSIACEEEKDEVVGIVYRCPFPSGREGVGAENCIDKDGNWYGSAYMEITVHTTDGQTYQTRLQPPRTVRVGDPWPPPLRD